MCARESERETECVCVSGNFGVSLEKLCGYCVIVIHYITADYAGECPKMHGIISKCVVVSLLYEQTF